MNNGFLLRNPGSEQHVAPMQVPANTNSHWLAQEALRMQECVVIRFNMPEEIRNLIESEAAGKGNSDVPCNISIP
jgi:hypothetical protein